MKGGSRYSNPNPLHFADAEVISAAVVTRPRAEGETSFVCKLLIDTYVWLNLPKDLSFEVTNGTC